jgi:hypothetical protein
VIVQVSSITIQPEVMHLLRQLLVTWLPRSEPIRQVLLTLPHVNQQVRLSLEVESVCLQALCLSSCCLLYYNKDIVCLCEPPLFPVQHTILCSVLQQRSQYCVHILDAKASIVSHHQQEDIASDNKQTNNKQTTTNS